MSDELEQGVPQPGMLRGKAGPGDYDAEVRATIDNRTDLPDAVIHDFISAHWVETAGLQFAQPSSFQMYATQPQGSMLARTPFRSPGNVIEEIKLARSIVDQDDDIKATVGSMISTAFSDGMENQHADEKTLRLFNRIARNMNLDNLWAEMYREWLIASQVVTLSLFARQRLSFTPGGTDDKITAQLAIPKTGIIPAEDVRVLTNDIFGDGELAYEPPAQQLKSWLDKFFDSNTSTAVKAGMRAEEPVLAALFTRKVTVPWNDTDMFSGGKELYVFNPRMVKRSTMPKGAAAYPRPLLTANFALLEAKRLLNIMDYAILQGGTNYIVVAKQGSDQLPAKQPEIDNLVDQVRSASRSGVLVGDHRLDIEIITPKLDEVLSPTKRKLIGRKLAMALLRIPEQVTGDPGSEGAKGELEFAARSIAFDRRALKRHVEANVYDDIADRNPGTFTKGAPSVWFPRIILSGIKDFQAAITSARDRGDIPRKWAVESLGYDYEAGVAQRKREKANGDDDVMTPGNVPFDAPGTTPDGPGRPPGSSPDNGRPGSAPARQPAAPARQLPPGVRRAEPVRAEWSEEHQRTIRVGELTAAILEEYAEHTVGRVTDIERRAVNETSVLQEGPVAVVPVNCDVEITELRAIRLADGFSMIVGTRRGDEAIVAKALCFREPHWSLDDAEATAIRFGYDIPPREEVEEETAAASPALDPTAIAVSMAEAMANVMKDMPVPEIHLQLGPGGTKKVIKRGENGEITEVEEVPTS